MSQELGERTYFNLLRAGYFPMCKEYPEYTTYQEQIQHGSPGFQFLFNKHKSHLSLRANVPLDLISRTMRKLVKPFLGEFVETTDSKEFLYCKRNFFKGLFWNDTMYVSFEDFNLFLNSVEIDPAQQDFLKNIKQDFKFPEGKSLQLGYRAGKDEFDRWHFVHIETGLQCPREDGKENMIQVYGDGLSENDRYVEGFNLAYRMILDGENINLLNHLCTKRMKVHFMGESEEGIKEVIDNCFNGHPFFYDKEKNFHVMSTTDLQTGTDFQDYFSTIAETGQGRLAELGKVVNFNPKQERMTTGENYKDLAAIANMQRLVLDQLKYFATQVSEKGNIELKFAINGIPEADDMEGDGEKAEGTETEKIDNTNPKGEF